MATATATPPSSTSTAARVVESIIAAYKTHEEAEAAVRKLEKDGVPIEHVSIIGHDFKIREEIDGYYVMGSPDEIARLRSILENTGRVDLNQFQKAA
jgi:hypothetical protein